MRKHSLLSLVFFGAFLFLMISCEKRVVTEEFDEEKFGFDYFPLELGNYWIYQADSTIYDDEGSTIINTSSQIKEEIVEVYEDEIGDQIHRIERYWRQNDSTAWQVTDEWASYTNSSQAIRIEENLKFIKFIFPPLEGSRWNGNIFFDENTVVTVSGENLSMFAGWNDYRIQSLDESEQIGENTYSKVATVLLTDDQEENTIERRFALEKYARGVGLVYKEFIILDSQCSSCTESWEEKAEKGFILKQTLIEHN